MGNKPARAATAGVLLAVVAGLSGPRAHGQSTFGGVVGTITDLQKAVVAGAGIELTEVRTNVSRSAVTTTWAPTSSSTSIKAFTGLT